MIGTKIRGDEDRDEDRDDEWEGGAANGEVLRPRRSHRFPLPSLSRSSSRSLSSNLCPDLRLDHRRISLMVESDANKRTCRQCKNTRKTRKGQIREAD